MLKALFRDRNAALDADVYALTILAAIRPGLEADVATHVRGMSRDSSPFRRLASTHFARLVVVDQLAEMPELHRQHLLFSAVIDGDSGVARDAYLREMCEKLPFHVDRIWGSCLGVPQTPSTDPDGFVAWMAAHQVTTRAFYTHYDASVQKVRHALHVHREVRRFASRAQYLTARELRQRVEARIQDWRG